MPDHHANLFADRLHRLLESLPGVTSRDAYLAWRAEWRRAYADLSRLIRLCKLGRKPAPAPEGEDERARERRLLRAARDAMAAHDLGRVARWFMALRRLSKAHAAWYASRAKGAQAGPRARPAA